MKKPDSLFRTLDSSSKILLIRLRSLGDVVLMTPVLESIRRIRPDIKIDVAVEHPFSEVLYENPFIQQIIELKSGKLSGRSHGSAASSNALLTKTQAMRKVRQIQYDAVWNLHGGTTSAWMTALSGSKYRIGCAQFRHRFVYNLLIPNSAELLGRKNHHTVEGTLAGFDWLNGEARKEFATAPPLTVVVNEAARSSGQKKLESAGVRIHAAYIVIQPGAVFKTKEWMPDRFAAMGDFLSAQGFQVVLTGTPQDRSTLEALRSQMRSTARPLTDLTIRELIAVIDGAQLYLGNDSGPAHIAAALKKPMVVLFGSSNSAAWSPWKTASAVVQNPFECNPCPGYSCWRFPEPECIKSITVEQVKNAIQKLILEGSRGLSA